jgi:hypothetical protein
MDRRVELIREFYRALPMGSAKVETRRHGFAYLDELLRGGASLEYGELTLTGLLHKYKLSGIPADRMTELLGEHVAGGCNVCLYFGESRNAILCFNLDNNRKASNTEVIPEMEAAVGALRGLLESLGFSPLVLASGRGFHLWCRLAGPVENGRLHAFMIRLAAKTAASLHDRGLDHNLVKMNLYPDRRTGNVVSLRLFGSVHSKNGVFSRVLSDKGLLDERASWVAFEEHLGRGTTSLEAFEAAYVRLAAEF